MQIYYIAHYSYGKDIENYSVAIPTRKKMDYLLYAIEKAGYRVEVFSVANLSTYIHTDIFANNSFPSELMTYVTHNLKIVTGDAMASREAKVSSNWLFYKDDSPESIAAAIMSYNKDLFQRNDAIVKELNDMFVESLSTLF